MATLLLPLAFGSAQDDGPTHLIRQPIGDVTYTACDTLDITTDASEDANVCLNELAWTPGKFDVTVHPLLNGTIAVDVQFASPKSTGIATVDLVTMEWYAARDTDGNLLVRPAVVVVHESGAGMRVGRWIATELARRGLHAFMVQLPGYGKRKSEEFKPADLVAVFKQGVADVRRARDAVAAIPQVDKRHIGLQGTSLGGFVASLAGSLDDRFDSNTLLLCGADLHGVLTSGGSDAQKTLTRLLESGVSESELKQVLYQVEPSRIAHRLSPEKTWLYSGSFDRVVLPKFSNQLANAIGLTRDHHTCMLANHYSGVLFLPGVLAEIQQRTLAE